MNCCKLHFAYLTRVDGDFVRAWSEIPASQKRDYLSILAEIEKIRLQLGDKGTKMSGPAHLEEVRQARIGAGLDEIRELDFQRRPSSSSWISSTNDRRELEETYSAVWRNWLMPFARKHSTSCARVYGGVKPPVSLGLKVQAFDAGRAELDLWDVIRFRFVATDLISLSKITKSFELTFASQIIRCRNYYLRPRWGNGDLYRAIHFELELGSGEYVEVQLLTAARDAVGLLDHALVRKKEVPYLSWQQEAWLRELSLAANLFDLLVARAGVVDPSADFKNGDHFSCRHSSPIR